MVPAGDRRLTMPRVSYNDAQGLWIAGGGDPGWAPLMAGIAYGESGWDTTVRANRPSTLDDSVGLWQINYYGSLRPSRVERYGEPEALQADPLAQARAAVDILGDNAANIGAWRNNPIVKIWQASGSPQKPSASTVAEWVRQLGGDPGAASRPDGSTTSTTGFVAGRVSAAPGVSVSNPTTTVGCSTGSRGITFSVPVVGEVGGIGNACQLKALSGGLMIGVGTGLLITGAVLLVSALAAGTKAGQTAAGIAGTVVGGPGGGAIAQGLSGALGGVGRSSGASRAIAGARSGAARGRAQRAEAEEARLFDEVLAGVAEAQRTRSPEARRFERERPARRRAAERASRTDGEPF